jgi:hypothetical protein
VSRCTGDLVEFKNLNGNLLPFSIGMLRELAELTRSGRVTLAPGRISS